MGPNKQHTDGVSLVQQIIDKNVLSPVAKIMWEKELEGKFKHRYMAKWAILEGQQIKKNEPHDHKEDLIEYHTPKGRASPDHPNVTKFSHYP